MTNFLRGVLKRTTLAATIALGFVTVAPAQSLDIGIVTDYDNGGGGLVVEYHTTPFFERGGFSLGWAVAGRLDADNDVWAGVGAAANFDIGDTLFVEASLMPGYYNAGETDLGGHLQFRTLLGLGTQISNRSALIISIDHMSNANIRTFNPGSNTVALRLRTRF
jgi:lipid A 3-O-deacylase